MNVFTAALQIHYLYEYVIIISNYMYSTVTKCVNVFNINITDTVLS